MLLGLVAYGFAAGAAMAADHEVDSCIELAPSPVFQEAVLAQPAGAETGRVALVIGNGAYQGIAALRNPTNDANAVAERLGALGFHVYLTLDASDQTILDCVEQLGPRLARADVGLFYYAGHGIQVDDDNYLIGVNAEMGLAGRRGLVRAADITQRFQRSARTTLVFLDACRNNPFAADATAGLAVADARIIPVVPPEQFDKTLNAQPTGLMVTYATSPNSVAYDGAGKHSPFTQAFLDVVGTPGYSIQQSISEIGRLVGEATNFSQTPWSRSSLTSFVFMNGTLTDDGIGEAARAKVTIGWSRWQEESDKTGALTSILKAFPQPFREEDLGAFAEAYEMLLYVVSNETTVLGVERPAYAYYSPDGRRIVTMSDLGEDRGRVELWDAESRSRIAVLGEVNMSLMISDFSADSSRYLVAETYYASEQRLMVWDANDGKLIRQLDETHPDHVELSPDGSALLLQTGNAGYLQVLDIESGRDLFTASVSDIDPSLTIDGDIYPKRRQAQFVPGRNAVVMVLWDGECSHGMKFAIIDLATRAVAVSPPGPGVGEDDCTFFPGNLSDDGARMVVHTGSSDHMKPGSADVFDTRTGERVFSLVSPNAYSMPITPGGTAVFEPQQMNGTRQLHQIASGGYETAPDEQLLLRETGTVSDLSGRQVYSNWLMSDGTRHLVWLRVPSGAALVPALIAQLPAEAQAEVARDRIRWYPDPMRD